MAASKGRVVTAIRLLVVVLILLHQEAPAEAVSYLRPSSKGGGRKDHATGAVDGVSLNSYERMVEFRDVLTREVSGYRGVQSSGGGTGTQHGVISEGQGYGLLLSSAVASSLNKTDPRRDEALTLGYQLFLGWQRMCQLTDLEESCQQGYCGSNKYPCLPSWKFDDNITKVVGKGSAADGDEDAILGMIMLVDTTKDDKCDWWKEVAEWAYFSCKAYMDFNTELSSSGKYRILKLGSCFGGWDCANPSYLGPAHYRVFRDYMLEYAEVFASNPHEGEDYKPMWDNLISTIYQVLHANQCPSTGLVTNWYKPNESNPSSGGSVGWDCEYSGDPPDQFGAEACRASWRVTLDYLWNNSTNSTTYLHRVGSEVTSKLKLVNSSCSSTTCNPAIKLDTPPVCFVGSVLEPWTDVGFMLGPVSVSLMVPLPPDNPESPYQQKALDFAADRIGSSPIKTYYSGSWIAITTLTLSGDIVAAKPNFTNANNI